MSLEDESDLDALLDLLKRNRGFDFSGYKRPSLTRRIRKRMQDVGVDSYAAYTELVAGDPEEMVSLFNTILINVTAFFRDDVPWDYMRETVIPRILSGKQPADQIRIWSAGCASGEEAYTVAMLFAEALGHEAYRERVKVYATDVDHEALTAARGANYTEKDVEAIPAELREKYLDETKAGYTFRKELRRSVIFGRNDLVQDAPISRIDLLICRNTLMYFDAPTQARILARFHFALSNPGYLFLGRAETLLTQTSNFTPLDLKRRIFVKVPAERGTGRLVPGIAGRASERDDADAPDRQLRDAALHRGAIAQIVLDQGGRLVIANDRARSLFHLGDYHLGRPFQDLELSYRPFELRSEMDSALRERRNITLPDVSWAGAGPEERRWFNIEFAPLLREKGGIAGVSISFLDTTATKQLRAQVDHSQMELEAAYEELQSTNEELETTNEELQSTIEELETTNEELQSTNEELETMNEELQSTNDELQTINDEIRRTSDELSSLTEFQESVFASMGSAVVVLDAEGMVTAWNSMSEELWGIRQVEAKGTSFFDLDIGLPTDRLKADIIASLQEGRDSVMTTPATNRRGREIECRISCQPLVSPSGGKILGAILMIQDLADNGDSKEGEGGESSVRNQSSRGASASRR